MTPATVAARHGEPMISERTRVALPVALQITLLSSVILCTATVVWVARGTMAKLDGLRLDVDRLSTEMYRLAVASEQALRMAIENPGVRVPDPRDPNKIIVVEASRPAR